MHLNWSYWQDNEFYLDILLSYLNFGIFGIFGDFACAVCIVFEKAFLFNWKSVQNSANFRKQKRSFHIHFRSRKSTCVLCFYLLAIISIFFLHISSMTNMCNILNLEKRSEQRFSSFKCINYLYLPVIIRKWHELITLGKQFRLNTSSFAVKIQRYTIF